MKSLLIVYMLALFTIGIMVVLNANDERAFFESARAWGLASTSASGPVYYVGK